jgi:trk system potassium uptake protein
MGKFAIIGLGKFGMAVATTLYENGAEVLAIDNDARLVEDARGMVSAGIVMDSTDERALRQAGLEEMDAVVLAIGNNIEVSVLTTVLLRKLGATNIYAKVDSQAHGRILEMIGVKHILFPEELIGKELAQTLLSTSVINYFELQTGHAIIEVAVPRRYIGKTLQELALPSEKGVHVVAIKYSLLGSSEDGENIVEERINQTPGANDVIRNGDRLVLLGPTDRITAIIKETARQSEEA